MNNEEKSPVQEGTTTEAPLPEEGEKKEGTRSNIKKIENANELLTVNQKRMREAVRWLLIAAASIIMGCSVYFFQTPYNITLGGIAGVGFLLGKVALSQGVWILIINGFLIVLGLIVLGKQCTIGTIFSAGLYTGTINILELIDKAVDIPDKIAGEEPLLALMYAVLLYGVGGAIVFNCGASSGGTDIIALIFKKFTHLNVGVALLIVDLTVIIITISSVDPDIVLMSLMGLLIKNFLLDYVIEGLGRTKYLTIITTMPDEIGNYIVEEVHHGYTIYDARGGFSGEKKNVILTICKRNEAWKIKTRIKQIDPSSFVIISNTNEIVGKGFGGGQ